MCLLFYAYLIFIRAPLRPTSVSELYVAVRRARKRGVFRGLKGRIRSIRDAVEVRKGKRRALMEDSPKTSGRCRDAKNHPQED